MANVNVMRFGVNNQKKVKSVSVAKVIPALMTTSGNGVVTDGTIANGDVVELFNLPENCVVTDAYFVVNRVSAENTAQITLKCGTDTIMDATAVGSAGNVVLGSLKGKVFTDTGKMVTATISIADLKSGEFSIVVAYDEIERNAFGDFTPTSLVK